MTSMKILPVIFLLLLICISCGHSSSSTDGNTVDISFIIDWQIPASSLTQTELKLEQNEENLFQSTMLRAPVDCAATGINTVQAKVNKYISSTYTEIANGSWACTAHNGTITSVPADSYSSTVYIAIYGKDSSDNILYIGSTSTSIIAGAPANAGTITVSSFVPLLVSPISNATFSHTQTYGESFDWSDVTGYPDYQIQISSSSSFSAILYDHIESFSSSSYITPSTFSAGTYYWRVRAVGDSGLAGGWSLSRTFIIN